MYPSFLVMVGILLYQGTNINDRAQRTSPERVKPAMSLTLRYRIRGVLGIFTDIFGKMAT